MAKTTDVFHVSHNWNLPLYFPRHAKVVGFGTQGDDAFVVAEYNPEERGKEIRTIVAVRLNEPLEQNDRYLGHVIANGEIYCIYERR